MKPQRPARWGFMACNYARLALASGQSVEESVGGAVAALAWTNGLTNYRKQILANWLERNGLTSNEAQELVNAAALKHSGGDN